MVMRGCWRVPGISCRPSNFLKWRSAWPGNSAIAELETLVLERHAFFVNHWRHHIAASLLYIDQCFNVYVKSGDFYAGYTGFHLIRVIHRKGMPAR